LVLFNSLPFICVFLPVVALIFFLLARWSHKVAIGWLCLASLAFYGWWNVHYLALLLASVVFNYGCGFGIARLRTTRPHSARAFVTFAVAADLLLLGYYKYLGFFAGAASHLFGMGGGAWDSFSLILPLGISFFTFTQIAFLADAYGGKASEFNFLHYLLFVTYFPHLIAGPILHHAQMMPQFRQRDTYWLNWDNVALGLTVFIIGLGKKVLLADSLSQLAKPVFEAAAQGRVPSAFDAWAGALAYTLQLYFDFSGYTDMAIGVSCIFNIRLPLNFDSPYKARNIVDFWRRWHMTLSAFLRDYLYIPLGGNRHGKPRRYLNLFLTMLLGGLWHGAGWTFVVWGGLHGVYLAGNHAFHALRVRMGSETRTFGWAGRLISTALTFLCVVSAWVIFRADNFATALRMLAGMSGNHPVPAAQAALAIEKSPQLAMFEIALGLLIVWTLPNTQQWTRLPQARGAEDVPAQSFGWQPGRWWNWLPFGFVLGFVLLTLHSAPPSEFLYFQF
jgi:D-alanyl-lipoteichoic acid acyltransferase DltB (MBOAT superfamily)